MNNMRTIDKLRSRLSCKNNNTRTIRTMSNEHYDGQTEVEAEVYDQHLDHGKTN